MSSEMEKVLGVPIGHKGIISGTVPIDGVEVVYFLDDGRDLLKQFRALSKSYSNPRHSRFGGMNGRGCSLTLPDGSIFEAVGYHGDVEGWRKDIEEGAAKQKITLARIEGDKLVISDGRVVLLSACIPKFAV